MVLVFDGFSAASLRQPLVWVQAGVELACDRGLKASLDIDRRGWVLPA